MRVNINKFKAKLIDDYFIIIFFVMSEQIV